MEVDVSYTGNLHSMRMVLVASGRLEYIPTVASASPLAVPETFPSEHVSTQHSKMVSEK